MRAKTYVFISSVSSVLAMTVLFGIQFYVRRMVDVWINQGIELSFAQKLMIAIANFWARFWWLGWIPVVAFMFLFWGAVMILQCAVHHKNSASR
jgi:hypothetical protein